MIYQSTSWWTSEFIWLVLQNIDEVVCRNVGNPETATLFQRLTPSWGSAPWRLSPWILPSVNLALSVSLCALLVSLSVSCYGYQTKVITTPRWPWGGHAMPRGRSHTVVVSSLLSFLVKILAFKLCVYVWFFICRSIAGVCSSRSDLICLFPR